MLPPPRRRVPSALEDVAGTSGAASSRAALHLLLRDRLGAGFDDADAAERRFARALDAACGPDVLDRDHTNGPRVLAAIRMMDRLELAGETLRVALNAVATVAPGWPCGVVPPDWHARHERRVEELRRPEAAAERGAYAARVGADGHALLDALDRPGAPPGSSTLPAVAALRRVWARHFERGAPDAGGTGEADGGLGARPHARCTPDAEGRPEAPRGQDARSPPRGDRARGGDVGRPG